MNIDSLYRLLMDSSWFFLCGWSITLVAASATAFRQEYRLELRRVSPASHWR